MFEIDLMFLVVIIASIISMVVMHYISTKSESDIAKEYIKKTGKMPPHKDYKRLFDTPINNYTSETTTEETTKKKSP